MTTTLTRRALNRAALARQHLMERTTRPVADLLEHLVGLQAQTPHTAYVGIWSRLVDFDPEVLSSLLLDRRVVRLALMRGTIHLVTARDAWALRPLIQPVLDRVQKTFDRRLEGIDGTELLARGRAYVDEEPRTFKALGDHLLERWLGRDRMALEQAIRTAVPLVQVPPRGLWGRSGPVAHTSIDAWMGRPPSPPGLGLDGLVRRYLDAFGPATVMDAQEWCGLTRLRDVFERLRPELVTFEDEDGRELFDHPDALRPDADIPVPVRYLYDYENLMLSYVDRSRMFTDRPARPITPRDNESISTFTVDGLISGTWSVERGRASATLAISPIVALAASEVVEVHEEGERLLRFLASDDTNRDIRLVDRWEVGAST